MTARLEVLESGPFAGCRLGHPAEVVDPRRNPRAVQRDRLRAEAHRELDDHVCDQRCGDST